MSHDLHQRRDAAYDRLRAAAKAYQRLDSPHTYTRLIEARHRVAVLDFKLLAAAVKLRGLNPVELIRRRAS